MGRILMLALILTTLFSQPAWCSRFQIGDRIQIQTTKDIGTVTAISPQGNCSIKMDARPDDPQGTYFEKSPNLQLYNGAATPPEGAQPGDLPAIYDGAPGRAAPKPALPRAPQFPAQKVPQQKVPQQQALERWVPMKPVGGNLTQDIIKRLVEDNYNSPIHHEFERMTFAWNNVQIGGPEKLDDVNLSFQNIAPGSIVYPVRADFNYTVQAINYANDVRTVDRIGYAYFYKDQSGAWAYTWYAHQGQLTKQR
jgi:hypothetical protein